MTENQLTSLELSKQLKKLGANQESLFYWAGTEIIHQEYCSHYEDCISAFTASELMEMLPENINEFWFVHRRGMSLHEISYAEDKYNNTIMRVENGSYTYCLAKMLINLMSSGML